MKTRVTIKPCPCKGRRVNQTPESDIPEEVKLAATEAKKAERSRRNGRTLSVWSAVLVGLPFVLPVVFYINGALTNHPLPIGLYPYLVLTFGFFAEVGGLILYIASRNANYLRKPIGWTALATALLPLIAGIFFGDYISRFVGSNLNRPVSIVVFLALLLTLLCMIALCVFVVLMLRRVYSKPPKPEPER